MPVISRRTVLGALRGAPQPPADFGDVAWTTLLLADADEDWQNNAGPRVTTTQDEDGWIDFVLDADDPVESATRRWTMQFAGVDATGAFGGASDVDAFILHARIEVDSDIDGAYAIDVGIRQSATTLACFGYGRDGADPKVFTTALDSSLSDATAANVASISGVFLTAVGYSVGAFAGAYNAAFTPVNGAVSVNVPTEVTGIPKLQVRVGRNDATGTATLTVRLRISYLLVPLPALPS